MVRTLLIFTALLLGILSVSGMVHWFYLRAAGKNPDLELLVLSYGLNLVMAAAIYGGMLYLALKKNKYMGFIFLWGSALKFAIYFLVLQPLYLMDGSVSRVEFFYFFVPYLLSLVAETAAVVKLLQAQDSAGQ